jgi:hypothetical protein
MIVFQESKDLAKSVQDGAKVSQDQTKSDNKVALEEDKENDVA